MVGFGSGAKRVAALEKEVADLRTALAELSRATAIEAERVKAAAAISQFGEHLLELGRQSIDRDERSDAFERMVAELRNELESLRRRLDEAEDRGRTQGDVTTRLESQDEALAALRSGLALLERRLAAHVDESARTAAALIERFSLVPGLPHRNGGTRPS